MHIAGHAAGEGYASVSSARRRAENPDSGAESARSRRRTAQQSDTAQADALDGDSRSDPRVNHRERRRRSRVNEGANGNGNGNGNGPYFERLEEVSSEIERREGYVRRLEIDLEDTKRICDESKRRLSALEYINEDLEKRLENESCRKLDLERELQMVREDSELERNGLNGKIEELEEKLRNKVTQEDKLTDKIRRLERELYRMHQKKHEILMEARRQEAQDRADDAEASQLLRAHTAAIEQRGSSSSRGNSNSRPNQLQDEAMAVEYFSRPSPALAEEQNRFRMAQSLGDFFQC